MQQRGTVTVHIPVVGARPDPGGPHLEGAPALRRFQFWARRSVRDDPRGATLIPFGIHDPETCGWLQSTSGLLHDAVLGRVASGQDADTLVVNVTTRDPAAVGGRSGTLAAACGEAAARWLRPGAGALLPVLAATGEIIAAGEEAACAGEALLVRPVEGVAAKLAGVAAMLAAEPATLRDRGLVVVLPAANLQGGRDVADISRELAALEASCAQAALNVRVVRARTLADVLAAWCPRDAWLSAEIATQLAGTGPVDAKSKTAPPGRKRFAAIGAAGVFAAFSVGVTADQGRPTVTLSPVRREIFKQVAELLPAAGLVGPPWMQEAPIIDLNGDGDDLGVAGDYHLFKGASSTIKLDGSVVGTLVNGRGAERESNNGKWDCFAAMVRPDGAPDLLVTVGKTPWSTRQCLDIEEIAVIRPNRPSSMRFGIIYLSRIPNELHNLLDPVVLAWTAADGLQVDAEATRRAASAEAKTMEDLLGAIK